MAELTKQTVVVHSIVIEAIRDHISRIPQYKASEIVQMCQQLLKLFKSACAGVTDGIACWTPDSISSRESNEMKVAI